MKVFHNIVGFGYHVPEKVVTNDDLAQIVDTNDEWIYTRTGIKERRIISGSETTTSIAIQASLKALKNANMKGSEITHIIVPTVTSDYSLPATAPLLAKAIGALDTCAAFDISAACTGFLYGLEVARAFLTLHPTAKILLATTETLSNRTNWTDRSTCVLFGDGASSLILTAENTPNKPYIIDILLHADGNYGNILGIANGGSTTPPNFNKNHENILGVTNKEACNPLGLDESITSTNFIFMEGREVFKHAVRFMHSVCNEILEKNGLSYADVDAFIPHQANARIIEAIGKKIDIAPEKIFMNVHKYGNTSAASIPIALAEAVESGFIKKGDKVLLTAFGAGLTWGAALVQF